MVSVETIACHLNGSSGTVPVLSGGIINCRGHSRFKTVIKTPGAYLHEGTCIEQELDV
jgi:hypothetical protein